LTFSDIYRYYMLYSAFFYYTLYMTRATAWVGDLVCVCVCVCIYIYIYLSKKHVLLYLSATSTTNFTKHIIFK